MEFKLTRYQMNQLADMVAYKVLAKIEGNRPHAKAETKLTAKEAAEYLKMPLSTLYKLGGDIPRIKVGKRFLYTEETLYNYIHR